MNELKNRGVRDILVLCADRLADIKAVIGTAFPKTEYQCCIVHQVGNTLKYASYKDRNAFRGLKVFIMLRPKNRGVKIWRL